MNQHAEHNRQTANQTPDQALDNMLGYEPELAPTSGFLAAVMDRVQEEAAAPAPIAFPWKRVLPGAIVAAGFVLGCGLATLWFLVPVLVEGLRIATYTGAGSIHISSSVSGMMMAAGSALFSWLIVARILRRA